MVEGLFSTLDVLLPTLKEFDEKLSNRRAPMAASGSFVVEFIFVVALCSAQIPGSSPMPSDLYRPR